MALIGDGTGYDLDVAAISFFSDSRAIPKKVLSIERKLEI